MSKQAKDRKGLMDFFKLWIVSSKEQSLYPCRNVEAKDFLSKAANENKAIEFRIESSSQKDSPFEICC